MSIAPDTLTVPAPASASVPASASAEGDMLIVRLPEGARELRVSRAGFDAVLDAAARMWMRNLPDDPGTVTLHLAMKTAARALLWFVAKRPMPGMPPAPQLTRRDDAVVVVVRYMLSWFFSMALRGARGGVHDLRTLDAARVADALTHQAPRATDGGVGTEEPIDGWYDFATALAALVAGPAPDGAGADSAHSGRAVATD